MHESIPAAPSPPGYCGAFARLVSPRGGAFANFTLPGRRAFANPELLTRTRFPIRMSSQVKSSQSLFKHGKIHQEFKKLKIT